MSDVDALRSMLEQAQEEAFAMRHDLWCQRLLAGFDAVGFAVAPKVATYAMQNAAIDVDTFKLGDISPLGFRCSPQQLFTRCYAAMLAAAPKVPQ
jgi:hypothetical protein